MKRTTKYVALDVHQAPTLASVREESGRGIARSVLPTDGPALTEFFRGMRGAIHVAVEEGTQAQWLHDRLAPFVDRVIVCDRRGEPRQGTKDDRRDADALSEPLRRGGLRAVYHGGGAGAGLKELTRCYQNLVEDATRVMLRLKALFRARAIRTPGKSVYHPGHRAQGLAQLPAGGARVRAEALYAELDALRALRPQAKAAMLAAARRDPAWAVRQTIPGFGPVRVALLRATLQTPWRFRTKRNLWAYAGLAVVTRSSADYTIVEGPAVRRQRAPLTRGLNRNHNRLLKQGFKGAATAVKARPDPLQDFHRGLVARGLREELADVTLAPRALTPVERQVVLAVLHEERFVDVAPGRWSPALLDEERYLCSERTMQRLLAAHQEVWERRHQRRHPSYAAPEAARESAALAERLMAETCQRQGISRLVCPHFGSIRKSPYRQYVRILPACGTLGVHTGY